MADGQWRSVAGTNNEIVVGIEHHGQGKGTAQFLNGVVCRLFRWQAIAQAFFDQMSNHFSVGLRRELKPIYFKCRPQVAEILNNTVMHHGDAAEKMRMGVDFNRCTMGGPTGMTDADPP